MVRFQSSLFWSWLRISILENVLTRIIPTPSCCLNRFPITEWGAVHIVTSSVGGVVVDIFMMARNPSTRQLQGMLWLHFLGLYSNRLKEPNTIQICMFRKNLQRPRSSRIICFLYPCMQNASLLFEHQKEISDENWGSERLCGICSSWHIPYSIFQ